MTWERARDRYLHDAVFKNLVDMLHTVVHEGNFDSFDLRDAAVFAMELHFLKCANSVAVPVPDPMEQFRKMDRRQPNPEKPK